ncbi:4-chlorobenzoate--CoA ligase [Bacillus sp. M6-12]|uniref:AMP-binding protein n=1 Tax=Bacillus sp. M6-12 TaxID=2054166 RepID=UPI000C76C890|nr:AMP-binding protein [Bacillus sp. M6-12]PLS18559.1 4-chlorobenzoate--CoA ligase [Bacillus sp. M6-12]
MNLSLMFDFAVERTPNKDAVVYGNERLTFKQWREKVHSLANGFAESGITKGDNVAICLKNSETFVTIFFALQKIGAVPVPFNFRSKKEGIIYYVKDATAKALIFDNSQFENVVSITNDIPHCSLFINIDNKKTKNIIAISELYSENTKNPQIEIQDDDLSVILYTSGTTGDPKGIPITHKNSMYRALSHGINHGFLHLKDEKVLGIMPLFHTIAIHTTLLCSIMMNYTYYPIDQFEPESVLQLIENEKITVLYGSPPHFQMLVGNENFDKYNLSSIEHILYGGAPMASNLVNLIATRISDNISLIYGNTETYNSLFFRHSHEKNGMTLCGVFHNVRVVAIGGEPHEIVKPGTEGELIIDMRSPEVFTGYLNKPDKTNEKVKNGWYYTGDSCLLTEDGHYSITGRVDDMIISGGENIHPPEVENYLYSHPDVKDAAIIGVTDVKWGQVVKAFIVKNNDSLTAEALDKFLLDSSLENFKRPRQYEFINEIPKSPSGKILRTDLKQLSKV